VFYESCSDVAIAIERERQLKNWHRGWKVKLIKQENPGFKDLAEGWYE
jgi:putative endonuclease